jgi:hypothetical protein
MVIGLWLFGLRMACRFSDGIVGLVAIEPVGTLLESVIMFLIPVGSNVRQPLVSIQFDFIVD